VGVNGETSDPQFLYLTTVGRKTGLLRQIEIWFVRSGDRLYILAEHYDRTQWVKNIRRQPRVRVRLGAQEFDATARVLDRERDAADWRTAQRLSQDKYGWGAGLPVEITPVAGS
jgi:deazaflavin-dependent oxidoreductase (nitroreductase family)